MTELIAKRYAKALLDVTDSSKIGDYISILNDISQAITGSKAKEIIGSPLIKSDDKVSMIIDALDKKADSHILNLIKVMGEKGRLDLIPELVSILKFEQKRASNSFVGKIESNSKLDKTELGKIEEALSKYSGAKIELEQVDSDLNGVKAEVEDLGLELNFSKDKVKSALLDYIQKAF